MLLFQYLQPLSHLNSPWTALYPFPKPKKTPAACRQQTHLLLLIVKVLGSLQDLDYLLVAFLPGISEELLFRGALLPLLGLNWKSAVVVGAIFGGLHLGGGRRYPLAIWASFVGFIYGMATIISSSIIVPMVSHSLSNLIGAILWRYKFRSEKMTE